MEQVKEVDAGRRIMLLRTQKGYSREFLSEKAGISSKFLYEIETRGKGFSANTLLRLAGALEVTMDYIMIGEGNPRYDEKLVSTIEMFDSNSLEIVKKLLEIAYELSNRRFDESDAWR